MSVYVLFKDPVSTLYEMDVEMASYENQNSPLVDRPVRSLKKNVCVKLVSEEGGGI